MPWECGDCRRVEKKPEIIIDAVCHHCGKPLCQEHRKEIVDDAFSNCAGPVSQVAYHCDECLRTHHHKSRLRKRASP